MVGDVEYIFGGGGGGSTGWMNNGGGGGGGNRTINSGSNGTSHGWRCGTNSGGGGGGGGHGKNGVSGTWGGGGGSGLVIIGYRTNQLTTSNTSNRASATEVHKQYLGCMQLMNLLQQEILYSL